MWSKLCSRLHVVVRRSMMKTIQMTIDEPLLAEVDQMIEALNITRSAFIRQALELALQKHAITEMEKKHAEGYARYPVEPGEFDVWEDEQTWGAS
jgi:metal-responsive CopG/Arc/MetJ family transcriptional regulator